jgi:hypothetical protein
MKAQIKHFDDANEDWWLNEQAHPLSLRGGNRPRCRRFARHTRPYPPIPVEDIVKEHLKLRIDFDEPDEWFGVPRRSSDPDILGIIFSTIRST